VCDHPPHASPGWDRRTIVLLTFALLFFIAHNSLAPKSRHSRVTALLFAGIFRAAFVDFVPHRLLGSDSTAEKLVLEVEMKQAISTLLTTLLMCAIGLPSRSAWGSEGNKIEGSWELVSGQNVPAGWKEIKLISGGHFIWVVFDTQKRKTAYTGGGTYKLDGDHYTEHVDFITVDGAEGMIDKDQPFTIKWEGNNLVVTGTLSNGEKLTETWKRAE
jgi:hypothetical protein